MQILHLHPPMKGTVATHLCKYVTCHVQRENNCQCGARGKVPMLNACIHRHKHPAYVASSSMRLKHKRDCVAESMRYMEAYGIGTCDPMGYFDIHDVRK